MMAYKYAGGAGLSFYLLYLLYFFLQVIYQYTLHSWLFMNNKFTVLSENGAYQFVMYIGLKLWLLHCDAVIMSIV